MYIPKFNENFEYGYPHSNVFLQFCLNKQERCKRQTAALYLTICDVINDSTVAFFLHYPIRGRIIKSSDLESYLAKI